MILSCSEKEHILARKLSVIERQRLSITIELILNSKAMLFHEPLTGLDVVSSTLLSTSLEKYKPKTVCNLSSTIFTNQHYGTYSGTGQPILGTMNKNDWTFNLYFNYLYYILTQILPTLHII